MACDEAIEQQLNHFDAQGDPEQLPVSQKQQAANALPLMCGVNSTG